MGMVAGILLGNLDDGVTAWIFCAIAGIFLYVALVDMIPELGGGGGGLTQLALQLAGLGLGVGIMLIIAVYEHDMKELFR